MRCSCQAFIGRLNLTDEFVGRPDLENHIDDLVAGTHYIRSVDFGDDVLLLELAEGLFKGLDGGALTVISARPCLMSE